MPLIFKLAIAAFFLYPYIDGLMNSNEDIPLYVYVLLGIFVCWVLSICFPSLSKNYLTLGLILISILVVGGFGWVILQGLLEGNGIIIAVVILYAVIYIFNKHRNKEG